MPKAKITQKFADSATCPVGKTKIQYWDTKTTRLFLEIYTSGKATYYYRFKNEQGTQRNYRIGQREKLKVKAVRNAVIHIEGNIAIGVYPATQEETKIKHAELRKQNVTFFEAYENEYIEHLQAKIKSHRDTIGRFNNHLVPLLGKSKLIDIKRATIEKTLNTLKKEKGLKNSSLNRLYADLSSFFTYFSNHDEYSLDKNPMTYVTKYKEGVKEYRELDAIECSKLIDECKKSNNVYLYYIISLLIYTGARRSEVLNAKWDDFNLEQNRWSISDNKQNKMDVKTLSDKAVAIVKEIPKVNGCEHLFPQAKNPSQPIRNIFHSFKKAKIDAGITKTFTLHDFRHQYATQLVRKGVDVASVQLLLGHSSIRTTLRYARIEHQTLLKAANTFGDSYGVDDNKIEKFA